MTGHSNAPPDAKIFAAALVGLFLLGGMSARAAESPFSGFWKLVRREVPAPAELTPAGAAAKAKLKARDDIDVEGVRWCVEQGLPYIMDNAGPIDIIVGPQELAILEEKIALPRHIYTVGQPHPDMTVFDNTPVGYSSGRWQGEHELVVETVGLSAGVGPAGAPRTETARLSETFKVVGDTLKVFTIWTDPATLRHPHRYTLVFQRLPANYTAEEYYCDPRDTGIARP
jgi:hypothetical protein